MSRDPSSRFLRRVLGYNASTGVLTWLPRARWMFTSDQQFKRWHTMWCNKEAGSVLSVPNSALKYRVVHLPFFGKKAAHRIIWAMDTGEWPNVIDHDDGDGLNNRLENLNDGDAHKNATNRKLRSDNSTGTTGIYKSKNGEKHLAQIRVNGELYHLGTFDTEELAIEARQQAEIKHNFNPNHGRAA